MRVDDAHLNRSASAFRGQPVPEQIVTAGETFQGRPVNVQRAVTFAMRSSGAGTENLLTQVRDAIASVKPDVALTRVRTLGEVYGRSMVATSFALVMLAIAATMALVLGIIGIYSLLPMR